MSHYIYSRWIGGEKASLDKDELIAELGRNLLSDGDLSYALWRLQYAGARDKSGKSQPSLQEMLEKLRKKRQDQLDKYNLGSIMTEIRKRLDDVLRAEEEGIQKRLEEARRGEADETSPLTQEMRRNLRQVVEEMAGHNLKKLSQLPGDVGSRIKGLTDYEFMDEAARQEFQELIEILKKNALESYGRDLARKLGDVDAQGIRGLEELTRALNEILEKRLRSEAFDFESFMREFGEVFAPDVPTTLEELVERLARQVAQAKSLLDSLPDGDREVMEELMQSLLDDELEQEMSRLLLNLEKLNPSAARHQRYFFDGDEPVSFGEALKLIDELQKIEVLENQLRESQYRHDLDMIDEQLVEEVMGDEAVEELDAITDITRILEEAGYLRRENDRYELTPRGMRKIGEKALHDIFARLEKDRSGGHSSIVTGLGSERLDETKPYEFGDPLFLNLGNTLMNALHREPHSPPLKLEVEDLEVFRTEELTRSATVLMLDLSLSMPICGNFQAAKQVAIALDGLIRSRYPEDSLFLIGFSSYAREIKKKDLYYVKWDELDPYTNMQHAFYLARKLLAKLRCSNKQIILISDGEPTAHNERQGFFFEYPPTRRTIQATLKEVRNCTQNGIVINTFMLERGDYMSGFVNQMARINKGRVFFARADNLGQYVLVDYIANREKRLSG
ncbi:MAG: VWA domain-containing protein [Chloroflexota bacterium]